MRLLALPSSTLLSLLIACGPVSSTDTGDGTNSGMGTDSSMETESSADETAEGGTGPASGTDTAELPPPADPCDPLVVEEAAGIPPECDVFDYAWNGNECQQLCECEGPHCNLITESPGSCFDGRWECPAFTVACPMQEGTAQLTGNTELVTGAFGITSTNDLWILFANNNLDLATSTHVRFAAYEPWGHGLGVRLPVVEAPGDYPVTGGLIQESFESEWTGTLTITELSLDGEPGTWRMSGSLTIADESASYEGDFVDIPGCAHLTS